MDGLGAGIGAVRCGVGLCQEPLWTFTPGGVAMCRQHSIEFARGIRRRSKQQRRYNERFNAPRMDVPKGKR